MAPAAGAWIRRIGLEHVVVSGVTLALEGGEGGVISSGGGATVSLRTFDLDQVVARLRSRGARVGDIQIGEHERRVDMFDPDGNRLVLCESLTRRREPRRRLAPGRQAAPLLTRPRDTRQSRTASRFALVR